MAAPRAVGAEASHASLDPARRPLSPARPPLGPRRHRREPRRHRRRGGRARPAGRHQHVDHQRRGQRHVPPQGREPHRARPAPGRRGRALLLPRRVPVVHVRARLVRPGADLRPRHREPRRRRRAPVPGLRAARDRRRLLRRRRERRGRLRGQHRPRRGEPHRRAGQLQRPDAQLHRGLHRRGPRRGHRHAPQGAPGELRPPHRHGQPHAPGRPGAQEHGGRPRRRHGPAPRRRGDVPGQGPPGGPGPHRPPRRRQQGPRRRRGPRPRLPAGLSRPHPKRLEGASRVASTMGGPPPQEQIDATLEWVTSVFRGHYAANPPEPPARFGRREFGFLWNGKKFFLRHVGFPSREAFQEFMARDGPHHAYYSTAYYKTPSAATMKEKEWLGADLIFDLDADHLPDADKMSYEEQLAEVKRQARKLLHEFLLGDFGFDPEHVRIVFSGGRGYHFHVTDPRVLPLDSAARREIVDYLSPNEQVSSALVEGFVKEKTWKKDAFGPQKDRIIPPASAPGWDGIITRTIVAFLGDVAALPEEEAVARLRRINGIGEKTAAEIRAQLTPERIALIREHGRLAIPALAQKKALEGL